MASTNSLRNFLRVNTGFDHQNAAVIKGAVEGFESEAAADTRDGYVTKVIKYIPGEIVAAYLFATNMIEGSAELTNPKTWLWIVFVFILLLTPIYRWRAIRIAGLGWDKSAMIQALIATLAYVAWAFALGGPFKNIEALAWNATIGTLVLMATTLTLPLIDELVLPVEKA